MDESAIMGSNAEAVYVDFHAAEGTDIDMIRLRGIARGRGRAHGNLPAINDNFAFMILKVCLCLLPLGPVTAQPTLPENPVEIYKGLGTWRHPIHTVSAEAQKFFDQGLALTYGFNRYEALRSYRKASEPDPQAAMPY